MDQINILQSHQWDIYNRDLLQLINLVTKNNLREFVGSLEAAQGWNHDYNNKRYHDTYPDEKYGSRKILLYK